jgi:hypothetical protein
MKGKKSHFSRESTTLGKIMTSVYAGLAPHALQCYRNINFCCSVSDILGGFSIAVKCIFSLPLLLASILLASIDPDGIIPRRLRHPQNLIILISTRLEHFV